MPQPHHYMAAALAPGGPTLQMRALIPIISALRLAILDGDARTTAEAWSLIETVQMREQVERALLLAADLAPRIAAVALAVCDPRMADWRLSQSLH